MPKVICKCGAEIKDEYISNIFYTHDYLDYSKIDAFCKECRRYYATNSTEKLNNEEAKELLINYINELK